MSAPKPLPITVAELRDWRLSLQDVLAPALLERLEQLEDRLEVLEAWERDRAQAERVAA